MKRYIIEDGKHKYLPPYQVIKDFNDDIYYFEGLDHLRYIFLEILKHKNSKITCDYLFKLNPYEQYPTGIAKQYSFEVNPEKLNILTMEGIMSTLYDLPWQDSEFKAREKEYYEVEVPKQFAAHREMVYKSKYNEFRRTHKRHPRKEEKARIEYETQYIMDRLPAAHPICPCFYPELNSLEIECSGKYETKKLKEFIEFMTNINITRPIIKLPNNYIYEYKQINLEDFCKRKLREKKLKF